MDYTTLPKEIYSGCWNGGHCQGIALDTAHKYIYFSFTTMLIKTDLEGNLIGSVTGLMGHLGCIDFCDEDGKLYGTLEYKSDAIGQGILQRMGSNASLDNAFYIAIFNVDKITRTDMDACEDGVMTTVFLRDVLDDYLAEVTCEGHTLLHRYGCSGIDGITFGPIPGSADKKRYLFVSYGIYGDTTRTDNDCQVILCYDTADWARYAQPLTQSCMHRSGPDAPVHRYFVYTGNTTYGVQNLEYDEHSGNYFMAVYRGKKPQYPNHALYIIDGAKPPFTAVLPGIEPAQHGEMLTLLPAASEEAFPGWEFPYGSTGLYALGNGCFYVSEEGRCGERFDSHVRLYRWDGVHPLIAVQSSQP